VHSLRKGLFFIFAKKILGRSRKQFRFSTLIRNIAVSSRNIRTSTVKRGLPPGSRSYNMETKLDL